MPASAYVDEAAEWAKEAVRDECRFPGDYKTAMPRVARRVGVSPGLIWALHYKKPKTISADAFEALGNYVSEQRRKYRQERSEAAAKTRLGRLLVRTVDSVVGEETGDMSNEA